MSHFEKAKYGRAFWKPNILMTQFKIPLYGAKMF